MATKNKRAFTRLRTSKRVEIRARGAIYLGTIEDNCDGGVFIETTGRFSEGQDISMTIESPKSESEKRTSRIVRVTHNGIGVKFNYHGYTR
jgi:Tfp pilus assembly protein PilZ